MISETDIIQMEVENTQNNEQHLQQSSSTAVTTCESNLECSFNTWKFPKFKNFLENYSLCEVREIFAESTKLGVEITSQVGPIEKKLVIFYNHPPNILSYVSINRYLNSIGDFVDISSNGPCWGKSKITKAIQLLESKIQSISSNEKIELQLGDTMNITNNMQQETDISQLKQQFIKKEKELRSIMEKIASMKN